MEADDAVLTLVTELTLELDGVLLDDCELLVHWLDDSELAVLDDAVLLLADDAVLLLSELAVEDDAVLLLGDVRLGVDQLDHEDAVLLVDELLVLDDDAVDALLADCEDSVELDGELALEGVMLDRLLAVLAVLALDTVLLLALDTLEAVD